jgi:aspartyl protease family protein
MLRAVLHLLTTGLFVGLLPTVAMAQTVGLSGMLGSKALLIVDGSAPKTVAVGETHKGVKVISTQGDTAVLEIAGKKQTLRVGDAPASVGASVSGDGGNKIVLSAGTGGHFFTTGQINGRTVQMMVDTGATGIGISSADADRMGIDYKSGRPMQASTANGVINGWRVKLASVQVGDVIVREVDAAVTSGSMPYVLLGNSFLGRFQMTRTNDQMVLEKRY